MTARALEDYLCNAGRIRALARTGLLESGPEESFERLGSLARRLVGAPVALVSLVEPDRQHFKCCLGLDGPYADAGGTPISHSICQYTLVSSEPLVIPDTRQDPRTASSRAIDDLDAIAYLGIPLVDRDGHILGSFCVLDSEPRAWTGQEVALMTDLAESVMAEIELRELALERESTAAALAANEGRLRAIMDGLFIFVGMLDTDGNVVEANAAALTAAGLTLEEVSGQPFWDTYWWAWDPATQDQLREAVRRAAGGQVSRYDAEIRLAGDHHTIIDFQIGPVRDDTGEVVALVPSGLDISERKRFESDLAQLADIESGQRRQAENLLTLARALTGALDISDVVGQITTIGSEVVGAAFANIGLADEAGDELILRHGAALEAALAGKWPSVSIDTSTPLGAAVATGGPVYLADPETIEREFPIGTADALAVGFQAMAAIPVMAGPTAAIGFAWYEPTDFNPSLQNALAIVAQLVGQALERAELYEREHLVASRLQRSLLPQRLPPVPGAEVAARYEAGAAGLDIGGDWYDVVVAGDRHLLAVGDVVGRGLTAAAAMGQLRNACAAIALTVEDPALLIEHLDRFALDTPDARLSTMVAAEFDVATGALRIVSAGHLPPLIRSADGSVRRVEHPGPPLGLEPGIWREALLDQLDRGDCLVIYTDGLVERRGETIDRGIDRLAGLLGALTPASAAELCDAVVEEMGSAGEDDVAVLVLIT